MGLVNRAFRNVWRKKTRTLLVVIALGFSVAAIISVYTGVEASTANTQEMITGYEEYIIETGELSENQEKMIQVSTGVFGRGFGGMGQTSTATISTDIIEGISSIDYVEAVIPLIESPVGEVDWEEIREQMRKARESEGGGSPGEGPPGDFQERQNILMSLYNYIIMGVPVNSSFDETYLILPENIVSGRKISENDTSMVMIREDLMLSDGYFAGSEVGDVITVEGYDFTIAGIYSSETTSNFVYMDISDAQKVLGLEEGDAYSLNVYTDDSSAVDLVVYDIEEMHPDLRVIAYANMNSRFSERRQSTQEAEIDSLQGDSTKIENTGNTIIVVLIIAVGLIVLFLMMYTVKERTKEIGLMKAIGFKGNSIMSQIILEGTVIGILGGIIGIILGFIAGPAISEVLLPNSEIFATSVPSFTIILLALVLTAFLGAAGTIYPAWQASKKSPMEAMRNE